MITSLLTHKKNILIALLLSASPLACEFLYLGFSSTYLQTILHFSPFLSLLITGVMLLITSIFLPIFGKIADQFPIKHMFLISNITSALITYPLYYCTSHGMLITPLLALLSAISLSCSYAILPFALASFFPTTLRYSCIGLSYNTAACLFGGSAPLFALLLLKQTDNLASPSYIIIATSILSLIGIYLYKEKKSID